VTIRQHVGSALCRFRFTAKSLSRRWGWGVCGSIRVLFYGLKAQKIHDNTKTFPLRNATLNLILILSTVTSALTGLSSETISLQMRLERRHRVQKAIYIEIQVSDLIRGSEDLRYHDQIHETVQT